MTNEEIVKEIQNNINVKDNLWLLYKQNIPLINQFVKPFAKYAEYEELMQEAYLGLQRATESYDEGKEVVFMTYAAFYIRHACIRFVHNNGNLKRIPSNMMDRIYVYNKYLRQYEIESGGKQPSDEEVMQYMNLTTRQYENMLRAIAESYVFSLEEKINSEDGSLYFADTLISDEDIESYCIDGEMSYQLWQQVDKIPDERQRWVIKQIYQENKTRQQLAEQLCVSGARVQQIEQKGLKILRQQDEVRAIAEAYDYDCKFAYKSTVSLFKQTGSSSVEIMAIKRVDAEHELNELNALYDDIMKCI